MEESSVRLEDVMEQNALCAEHYIQKEIRNLYVKSLKKFIQ